MTVSEIALHKKSSVHPIEMILCLIFFYCHKETNAQKLVCADRFWREIWWGNQLYWSFCNNSNNNRNKGKKVIKIQNSKLNGYKLDAKFEYSMMPTRFWTWKKKCVLTILKKWMPSVFVKLTTRKSIKTEQCSQTVGMIFECFFFSLAHKWIKNSHNILMVFERTIVSKSIL